MALLSEFPWPTSQKEKAAEDEKIWSKILEDVSSEIVRITQGSAVILGDDQCGKSALVARMIGTDRTPNPSIFEYNYLTVHANEDNRQAYQITSSATSFGTQDSLNLPLWISDGANMWTELFEFAFPKNLSKCVLILCASFAQPSKVVESLIKWYGIADAAIRKHYSEDDIKEAKALQMRFWQEYVEPAESMYSDAVNSHDFRPDLLEPEQGVLTESCGAPVIVVLTKTDEKSSISGDDLSRLQYQVRKFCLRHGAALIYTSATGDTNTQLLRKYVAHRVYGVPFTKPAYIVDESSIFIPSGWDSEKKLDAEREMLIQPDLPINTVEELSISAREKIVECEDEQVFLAQLSKALAENPSSPKREAPTAPPLSAKDGASPLANYFGSLINKKDVSATVELNP